MKVHPNLIDRIKTIKGEPDVAITPKIKDFMIEQEIIEAIRRKEFFDST